jgi:hypothetical protein
MESVLHKLNILWLESNYVDALTLIVSLILLIKVQKLKHTTSFIRPSIFLLISIFLLFAFQAIFLICIRNLFVTIKNIEIINLYYSCIEIFVFYSFFSKAIENQIRNNLLRYGTLCWIVLFVIMSIYFLKTNVTTSITPRLESRRLSKLGETMDVFKRCFYIYPCILYFNKVFITNQKLNFYEALVVYMIFVYAVLGILVYSLGTNIVTHNLLRPWLMMLPNITLCLLCYELYRFLKNSNVKKLLH